MTIADVIGWKFNHQPEMRCKEINGVMTIVDFPGGIPSQAEQDAWTLEYEAWIVNENERRSILERLVDSDAEMGRVGEDAINRADAVINKLVEKGVLSQLEADAMALPAQAREKLAMREQLRARLAELS